MAPSHRACSFGHNSARALKTRAQVYKKTWCSLKKSMKSSPMDRITKYATMAMVTSARARPADPWLHAWHDPVAGLSTPPSCVRLADLDGDGEAKLLVADSDKKLKIFKGTSLVSEHQLLDVPVALCTFYTDASLPRAPAVAVASGSFVFIYRNLRPYYKFTVPPLETNSRELEMWARVGDDRMTAGEAWDELSAMRDNGIRLTSRSVDFLDIEDGTEDFRARRERFAARWRRPLHSGAAAAANAKPPPPPTQHTSVTCFTTLKRESEEWDAPESRWKAVFRRMAASLHPLPASFSRGDARRAASVEQVSAVPWRRETRRG